MNTSVSSMKIRTRTQMDQSSAQLSSILLFYYSIILIIIYSE